jgi:nucleotide-binding universal stress UspA family protein
MKMLICSIGSRNRKATLHFAGEIAKAMAADTTLLGVVQKRRQVEQLGLAMDQIVRELAEHGLTVDARVEAGDAEKVLLDEIKGDTYDLIAIGALGGKRARYSLLESVSKRIMESADGSILVIKGDRLSVSRVLICSSATEHGRLSIWTGATLACATGAQATLLHVLDAVPAMYTGLERMEETLAELLQSDTEAARELKWAAQVIKAECRAADIKLRRGIVATEILLEAEKGDHDLVVLGSSRSPGGIVRVLMGDVAAEVVARARRPVLVVRPPE